MSTKTVALDRPSYGVSQAARLLQLQSITLRRWLDGFTSNRGTTYEPVIREEHTGVDLLSWGEFVEAGWLAEYRKREVPLPELRLFVRRLRSEFGVPYPLAHTQPWVSANHRLVEAAQDEAGMPDPFKLVAMTDGQLLLTEPAERYFDRVDFSADGVVERLHPDGRTSPVVIDPLVRAGEPAVRGVTVDNIVELYLAGEEIDVIAESYDLSRNSIEAAVRFDSRRRQPTLVA